MIFAGAAVLAGWLVYDQTRDAHRSEVTPDARSGAFDVRDRATQAAPPLPYRFAGTSSEGGATQYLLAKDGRVFAVTVGAILDGVYRVESIGEREMALVYLPTGLRQTVALEVAPWPPAGEPAASSGQPAKPVPLPPAVQRTRSPELIDMSR